MNQASCPHCGGALILMKTAPESTIKPTSAPATMQPSAERTIKLVECNRCGEGNLCWQESKNGKFYLCRTRIDNGRVVALRKEFHNCP